MSDLIARHAPAGTVVAGVVFIVGAWVVLGRRNADVRRIKRRHHE